MLAYVLIREQREWRRFPRSVAWRAILKNYRGDVFVERDGFCREGQGEQKNNAPSHCGFSMAQPTAFVLRSRMLFPAITAATTSFKSWCNASGLAFPISRILVVDASQVNQLAM